MFVGPKSNVSMVQWPALPEPTGALLLAILRQFDETERLAPADLEALQFRTLAGVLRHACDTVPHYRERPVYPEVLDAGPLAAGAWRRLPLLTREAIQDAGGTTTSDSIPADHHPLSESITSGSTGRPVGTLGTRSRACSGTPSPCGSTWGGAGTRPRSWVSLTYLDRVDRSRERKFVSRL